jgi:hypothetical protein
MLKISVCVPALDYAIDSDYNNFPWQILEINESVEAFELALKNLSKQACDYLCSFTIYLIL